MMTVLLDPQVQLTVNADRALLTESFAFEGNYADDTLERKEERVTDEAVLIETPVT